MGAAEAALSDAYLPWLASWVRPDIQSVDLDVREKIIRVYWRSGPRPDAYMHVELGDQFRDTEVLGEPSSVTHTKE